MEISHEDVEKLIAATKAQGGSRINYKDREITIYLPEQPVPKELIMRECENCVDDYLNGGPEKRILAELESRKAT